MLKRRLIPKLQLGLRKSFRGAQPVLVVTRQFGNRRAIGNPLSQAKIYEAQLADELILVDLERTEESWPVLLDTVEAVAEALATPLAVGGGVHSLDQVQALLDRGADKVVLNSAPLEQPELINRVANAYGAQCLVLSLDVRPDTDGGWRVWSHGGKLDAGREALSWACEAVDRGAGEVMVTAIERDGTAEGIDLALTAALTEPLVVPVIASGGVGNPNHMTDGILKGKASAVLVASIFHFGEYTIPETKQVMKDAGIPVRL